MTERHGPDIGQMPLPDMPHPAITFDSLRARNSFAKAATPEFYGLNIEGYADVTEAQINYVTPQLLHDSLIGVPRTSPYSAYYRNPETRQSLWIAVTPGEFKHLGGNIVTLGNRVMSQVSGSRSPRLDFTADRAAAVRGGMKAVEREKNTLETYRDKTLSSQHATVKWLAHAANSPGYAWKQGIDLRLTMTTVRSFVFADMLTAMSESQGWSPEKTQGVQRVIDYRLFFDRQRNRHIGNWKQMLGLADEYLAYKTALYNEKIWKAGKFLSSHE